MQVKLLVLISAGAMLFGSTVAEVWNSKEFAAWTVEDAEQVVSHSPWAKERRMPISERPGISYLDLDPVANPSAPPVGELGSSQAARSGPAATSRTASSTLTGAPASQPNLKIVWASARPVRLAVLKLRSGPGGPTAEEVAAIERQGPDYVIAVVGLPAPEGGSDTKALAGGAFLGVTGQPPVAALDSGYRRIGEADVYFFRFSKAALPLSAATGEVEFKLKMGRMKLSQKFELAGMMYKGQLAL